MRCAGLMIVGCLAACSAADEVSYEETQPTLFCSTVEPPTNQKMDIELQVQRTMGAHPTLSGATVEVYVHVIHDVATGDVSDDQIHQQLAVLNAAYRPTGFQFHLAAIDRTINTAWSDMVEGTAIEHTAKAALRKGTAKDLNLYIAGLGASSLGWSTFPSAVKADPIRDGVVILYSTLPGGSSAPFDQGDRAVHEIGHWLGLFHTYQADCRTANGDFVDDTPATDAPAFGCPVGRDTCGGEGDDEVRNYMDSSDDSCMNGFTDGQAARMKAQFATFRR